MPGSGRVVQFTSESNCTDSGPPHFGSKCTVHGAGNILNGFQVPPGLILRWPDASPPARGTRRTTSRTDRNPAAPPCGRRFPSRRRQIYVRRSRDSTIPALCRVTRKATAAVTAVRRGWRQNKFPRRRRCDGCNRNRRRWRGISQSGGTPSASRTSRAVLPAMTRPLPNFAAPQFVGEPGDFRVGTPDNFAAFRRAPVSGRRRWRRRRRVP